tara:strand:- start:49112 stop:49288 length:177 start_codon:yes stop_codon:yes gene_type:complete
MQQKENDLKTKFIKESNEETQQYILQKNKKTKTGAIIIIAFLVLIIVGVAVSWGFFEN